MYLYKEGQELTREDIEIFVKKYTDAGYTFPIEQNFSIDIEINQHQEKDNIAYLLQYKTLDYLFYVVFKNYQKIKKITCQLNHNTGEKEHIEINISLIEEKELQVKNQKEVIKALVSKKRKVDIT